jgi:hypothetical protein
MTDGTLVGLDTHLQERPSNEKLTEIIGCMREIYNK